MTEFRTKGKGKEKKVYPINRKAYGIPRELALKDVQQLRDQGKRARLIKTNMRLDLYTPYEATLPKQQEAPPEPVVNAGNGKDEENPGWGALNPSTARDEMEQISKAAGKGWSPVSAYSKDGKSTLVAVDDARVAMIYEILEGTVEPVEPVGQKVRKPNLSYTEEDSSIFRISKEEQATLLKEIKENKEASEVVLYKPVGSFQAYIALRGTDPETNDLKILGKPMEFMMFNSNIKEFITQLDVGYFRKIMRSMKSLEARNGEKNLTVKFKTDYPVNFEGHMKGGEFGAMIAPRIADQERETIRQISVRLAGGNIYKSLPGTPEMWQLNRIAIEGGGN